VVTFYQSINKLSVLSPVHYKRNVISLQYATPGAALSFQWTPKRTAVIQIQNREYCTGNQSHRTRDMFRHRAPQITHTRDLALYKSKAPSLEYEIVSFALMIQHITFGASLYQV
jgi:hypothetical protein